jgi:hypothetical protein
LLQLRRACGQAESVSTQTELADALHIDSFGVGRGEDPPTTFCVGKRISRVSLSYEQSSMAPSGGEGVVSVVAACAAGSRAGVESTDVFTPGITTEQFDPDGGIGRMLTSASPQ